MFEDPNDAVFWLREKSGKNRIYALLRGANLFHHPESKLFQACVELAELLRDEVDTVTRLLLYPNWRVAVVGNMVVAINRDRRYEQVYAHKFIKGHVAFAEPFAAVWAIINTGKTVPILENHLLELSKRPDKSHDSISYGTTLAIYAALRLLKRPYAGEFEATELFRILCESNDYPHTVQSTESNYAAYLSYNPTRGKHEENTHERS